MKNVGELGVTAAGLMDRIEADYSEFNEVEVGVVAVIAEINYEKDGEEYTSVEYRCSDPRKWIQGGLFKYASKAVFNAGNEE